MAPLDQLPTPAHPETVGEGAEAATLCAEFIADERSPHLGLYTGARVVLPTGEGMEVRHRRTPLYDLTRELEQRGYSDARLEAFTHTGTPSLRGLVKIMAGLTVEESGSGLRLRKYRPARCGESVVDAREDD